MIAQSKGGNKALNAMATPGCGMPALPINAKVNPRGNEPQAKAVKNEVAGILVSPAMHATTSGRSGSQRDSATTQPPRSAKIRSPRDRKSVV